MTSKIMKLASAILALTLFYGCTDINPPAGAGPGTGKICATVDTDEKGPLTLDIQAVAIGGASALTKITGTATVTGPIKGATICTQALPGDPELQKWEVTVTVSKGGKQVKRKSFDPATYKY